MKNEKNILITTYWSFDDALIQSYTLPYVQIIRENLSPESKIFILTLNKPSYFKNDFAFKKQIDDLEKNNIYILLYKYKEFNFFGACYSLYYLLRLTFLILKNNINYIHGWCTPGGAVGYLLSVLTKKALVIDSFEPHAEAMVEAGIWKKNSLYFKLLFAIEKRQLKRAKEVICTVDSMIAYSQKTYQIIKPRYFSKPACVDLNHFKLQIHTQVPGIPSSGITCVYVGKFGDLYLEKEIFDFFKVAYDYFNGDFKVLLLTNQSEKYINSYCQLVNLPQHAVIRKFVKHEEVPYFLSVANFAISPFKPLPSRRYCTPIKNGEYWAMGLPIIITKNISDDSDIIKSNDIGYVLNELNFENYLAAIKHIDTLLKNKPHLSSKIIEVAKKYRNFEIAKKVYQAIYA